MADRFPRPVEHIDRQDNFQPNEVGITHPNNPSFVRIRDNGDIELVAGEGCAIILHPGKRSITFVADTVKFLTRDGGGLRWNNKVFNEAADGFQEPTLLPVDDDDNYNLYKGVEHFLMPGDGEPETEGSDGLKFLAVMVTDPATGLEIDLAAYYKKYGKAPRFGT